MQRRSRILAYGVLALIGAAIPYALFIPWLMENGPDFYLLVLEVGSTRMGQVFTADLMLSVLVLLVFMGFQRREVRVRHAWVAVVGAFTVALSFALPLYLMLRERALEEQESVQ
jgi:hypothetical protein